jgi:hypothetical protein
MAMNLTDNWALKQLHELRWGISTICDDRFQLRMLNLGGSCERLQDQNLDLVNNRPIVVFGNVWCHKDPRDAARFHHPRTYAERKIRWFYWDNPLPHLLYKGPWNPSGHKNFIRLVENNTMRTPLTPRRQGQSTDRINHQLAEITNNKVTHWREIVGPRRPVLPRGKTVLLCPSGGVVFEKYYGMNKTNWIREVTEKCRQMGFEVELRDKPGRNERERADNRLYQKLYQRDYLCTISNHSMTAIESLIAGVPAVASGVHSAMGGAHNESGELCLPMAQSLQDFYDSKGALICPDESQVDYWVEQLLLDCYHKRDIYNGSWYRT